MKEPPAKSPASATPQRTRAAATAASAAPSPSVQSILRLQGTIGNQATQRILPGKTDLSASNNMLQRKAQENGGFVLNIDPKDAAAKFLFAPAELPIRGPLPPGTVRESHGLTVIQVDAQHAEINYGDSWVRLAATPGDVYAYSVGLPITPPPSPQPTFWPLIEFPDPDAKPVLPQRLVRVIATRSIDEEQIDPNSRVPSLAVQTAVAAPAAVADEIGLTGMFDVWDSLGDDYAQIKLEDSIIRIEVDGNAAAVAGDAKRARFAYWIDPEWTGPNASEKRVVIVAAPGVRVRTGTPDYSPEVRYGRKLIEEVVRVPHPDLVPEQGARLDLEQFISVAVVDPDATPTFGLPAFVDSDTGQHTKEIDIATGLAGIAISHPWSGARLILRPTDPAVGAAYAWQVLPPAEGLPGEIRAVVGPDVDVELQEPVPTRLRDPQGGPTPTPRKGQAVAGEGLSDQDFQLRLVEVRDPASVPRQGTPLNIDYLLSLGDLRNPDHHAWLGTNDLPFMLATTFVDVAISSIPIVGPLYMIGEFTYTIATGHTWWGDEIDDSGKVLMGVGAAISLIPLVGGLGGLLRGAAKMATIAEFAARWGTTTEELENVLIRVGAAVDGGEGATVQRAMRAIQQGGEIAEEDVPALQRVLAKVGAGHLGIEGIARSAAGKLELALAAAGQPLQSENYLANLMSAYRITGNIPDALVAPLAHSGQFGNAEEAAAVVQQALRDLARAEGVIADEALIGKVAARTGQSMSEAQAASVLNVTPQSRNLAVSSPHLFADYERLANEKLPDIIRDVLQNQGSTPARTRLAQLRTQFEQLRAQVGNAQRLTDVERDTANELLREARDLARDDFNNVRKAVWRRLRNPRLNPDLAGIERELRAVEDVQGPRTGALRVKMATAAGDTSFEPLNLEHLVRLSDNPWLYNDPSNLLASDAAQNQQYLEAIRQYTGVWPSDPMEDFIIRYGLNDQGIDFAPRHR